MKTARSPRPRGGVLVLALLCSGIAVIGFTYWIMTVGARSRYVDTLEEATKRRLARANGRTIAFRYMHAHVLPGTSNGATFSRGIGTWYSGYLSYEWGGVSLETSWEPSHPLASWIGNPTVNRISPADHAGFGLVDLANNLSYDLPLHILDGSQSSVPHRWQARSYPPALAGDLLVVHRPAPADPPTEVALTGSIEVNGRAHFYDAGSLNLTVDPTVTFNSYSSQGPGLVDTDKPVTNYPPLFGYSWAGNAPPVPGVSNGLSNVIWDETIPNFSLRNKVLAPNNVLRTNHTLYMLKGNESSDYTPEAYGWSDGDGTVTINLGNLILDGVVVENAHTIELVGQSTPQQLDDAAGFGDVAGYPTALVVVHSNPADFPAEPYSLAVVNFRHKNNRRLVFAVRCATEPASPVTFNFPDAYTNEAEVGPDWRGVFILEQTPVTFSIADSPLNLTGGTLNLTGGISTDRSIAVPGALRLFREVSPVGLSTKSPRRIWAEGFRMD